MLFQIIALIIAIVLVAFCLVSAGLAFYITGIKRQSLREAKAWQDEHYDTSFWDELEKTEYEVRGFRNYLLHAMFVVNPKDPDSKKYVILSHGHTDNRMGDLKYLPVYLSLGFHCIIYDLRGHGINAPSRCSYSIREREDLLALIRDSKKRYGDDIILGLHGESLGGATTIASLYAGPEVAFAVADCAFADIENVLRKAMSAARIPGFVLDSAMAMGRLLFGFDLKKARPIDSLKKNEIPILFIHGKEDRFIPPENSQRMAEATGGLCEVHLFEGAGHAESVLTDPERYRRYVGAFLGQVIGENMRPHRK